MPTRSLGVEYAGDGVRGEVYADITGKFGRFASHTNLDANLDTYGQSSNML
jgi:hypothetical protein